MDSAREMKPKAVKMCSKEEGKREEKNLPRLSRMLSHENRLIQRRDFQDVFRKGRFFSYGSLSVKFLKNNLKKSRFGVSVGLKFSKKAVERNRVRRQIRAILRVFLEEILPGFDLVFVVSKKNGEFDKKELENSVRNLLEKSGLILKK